MKSQLIILIIQLIGISTIHSQNYMWQWANAVPVDNGLNDPLMCTDESGHVYVSFSYFGNEMTIGDFTVQNVNPSDQDIVIAKYDSDGNVLWAKGFGGSSTDRFFSMVCDNLGNIIVSGGTNSSELILDSFNISPAGGYDSFLGKMNGDGEFEWVKIFGGTGNDFVRPIQLDANNNIYASGYFYSPTLALDDLTITNSGAPDTFLAKFDSEGNTDWAFGITGQPTTLETPLSIDVYDDGQVLLCGTYNSMIQIESFTLQPGGASDGFILLANEDGTVTWVTSLSTPSYENITDVEFLDSNTFYCTGWYEGTEFMIGDVTLTNESGSGSNVFVASFETDGSVNWAINTTGNEADNLSNMTVVGTDVFLAIGFESTSFQFDEFTFENQGYEDVCVLKIDESGDVVWADAFGAEGYEFCNSIAGNQNGDIYVSGTFASDEITFGNQVLINPSEFGSYLFLSKLSEIPAFIDAPNRSINLSIFPNPCRENLFVQMKSEQPKPLAFEVSSIDGKGVMQGYWNQQDKSISIEELRPGSYHIVFLHADGHKSVIPFIKVN